MRASAIQKELKLPFRKICQLLSIPSLKLSDELNTLHIAYLLQYAAELTQKDELAFQNQQLRQAVECAKSKAKRKRDKKERRESKRSSKARIKQENPLNPNAYVFPKETIGNPLIYTPSNGKVK
ncbi:MAG: hypothetical protein ACRYG7_41865 [Janthinobacterium lividum]